jgi:hypothetical protein
LREFLSARRERYASRNLFRIKDLDTVVAKCDARVLVPVVTRR